MHKGEKFVINIAESTKYILIKYQNYDSTENIALLKREKNMCRGEWDKLYNFNNYISFIEPFAKTFDYLYRCLNKMIQSATLKWTLGTLLTLLVDRTPIINYFLFKLVIMRLCQPVRNKNNGDYYARKRNVIIRVRNSHHYSILK